MGNTVDTVPTQDGISKEENEALQLMGAFARRTYGNEKRNYGQWQQIAFESPLTHDVSANGLNDFYTGFQAHAWENHDTKEIVFAISGTNDLVDVLSWPASLTGKVDGQVEDVILAAKKVNALVQGDSAPYAGYKVRVTGHSLGGELAQIAAYTYGWDGVSFDGPGGGAVVDGEQYKTFVKAHDITPVGHAGKYIDVNVDSDGIYGGSLVGIAGYDVAGVDNHYYTRSKNTALLPNWRRDFSENVWLKMGALPGKVITGVLVHYLDFIRRDIVDGNVVVHPVEEEHIYTADHPDGVLQNILIAEPLSDASIALKQASMSGAHEKERHDVNVIGHALQEIEGNVFSSAWSLASGIMQLHLNDDHGGSLEQTMPNFYLTDQQPFHGFILSDGRLASQTIERQLG